MADVFTFSADATSEPANGSPSGDAGVDMGLSESLVLDRPLASSAVFLLDDNPKVISLGDLAGANVLIIRASNKVRVRVTTTDGAQQSFPADPLAVIITGSVPITAIDVTRAAGSGVNVTVNYALGQKA